jgi:hypothetical protein
VNRPIAVPTDVARLLDRHPRLLAGILVASIATMAWRFRTYPAITLDLSWEIGLHQAAASGLRFGHDIVWTYGPLGFLAFPTPFVGATSALAFASMVLLVVTTVAILWHESRRLFPAWAAVIVTLVAARALGFILPLELLQFVALALGVQLLRRERPVGPVRISVAAGVLAAVMIMAKLNVGVFVTAGGAAVIFAIATPRIRGLVVYGAAFVLASIGIWIATAQQPFDLVTYARASIDVISGYSEAMPVDKPGMGRALAAFGLVAVVVLATAYRGSVAWRPDRRLALAVVMALLLFSLWKQGFVRSHFAPPFVTLGFALLVLMPRSMHRWPKAGALALAAAAFAIVTQISLLQVVDVPRSARDFAHQAVDALLPWRWETATAKTRQRLQASFGLPQEVVDEIAGRTVHVDPYQAAVATAYPVFAWRPLPAFQSYQAYTPYLDELNAAALRSPQRPERILRNYQARTTANGTVTYAVDGRNYWFESPAATLERLCRYREVLASQTWQVLADTGRGCGVATPIGRVTVALGETVQVPAPASADSFVLVRVFGLDAGLPGSLRVLAWRAPESFVMVDGVRYRLIPATATAGLMLSVPTEAQGSAPFAFGEPVRSISVRTRLWDQDGKVTFEFLSVPATGGP